MSEVQATPQPDMRTTAPDKPWSWALLTQAVCYVVLVLLALIPGSGDPSGATFSFTAFAVAVMIVLFAFFAPLRDGVPGRVIAACLGLCAMVCATVSAPGKFVFEKLGHNHGLNPVYLEAAGWLAGAGTLLVVLVVAGFIRQMARKERPDMIVQMAHMDLDGICAICASGWCLLPMVFQEASGHDGARIAVLACVFVVAALFAWLDSRWYATARPLDGARSPWLGFGLMPVMLTGAAVGVAAMFMYFM
ncbi:MAG: transporter [Bifidobacterium sp.]|nr:transporter [Bifidobacterium sp.]